mgnify:CR=1 FL=1
MISLLDQDLYAFTHSQVAFSQFPEVKVKYEFINRGGESFYDGFDQELQKIVWSMMDVKLSWDELEYLENLGYFKPNYLEWLYKFRYNPEQVDIQWLEGKISINIIGPWFRTCLWETPILAAISELYFKNHKINRSKAIEEAHGKVLYGLEHHASFSDFGTRRRFSYSLHEGIIEKCHQDLLGTSNVHLARTFDLPTVGTMSHQGPMVMQAYNVQRSNGFWMETWIK